MRAIVATTLGDPDVLQIAEAPRPEPAAGQALQIGAFGLDLELQPETWAAARRDLIRWVEEGALRLTISRVLPLAEAAEAHRLLESRQSVGKILLDTGLAPRPLQHL